MKKILSFLVLLMLSASLHAQKEVTKFLGIPVDGSKSSMIQKLEAKGFVYNSAGGYLEGEFNGENVYLKIATNNNKVWRIAVVDKMVRDEVQIKTRYNTLCHQFKNNSKYIPYGLKKLPDSEDISYEMTVNEKRYQANFRQLPTEGAKNRIVWFTIVRECGDYYIVIYYDNLYNKANGEDL